ncbi:MAG: TRAP transporter large permease [bacterium]|nr:TRAP transporter large permease [bacterium]
MTDGSLLLLVFGLFAVLLALRVPVAFCLGLSAFAYFFAAGLPPMVVVQKISVQMSSTTLMAIPFFILCGEIMSGGGMARRLIDAAGVFVGMIRGGLAMVNIVASMFFGGISGSSVADTSSIGSLLIPTMVRKGYHRDFSVAVTVTSSTQGIIIPPSHNAIIYSLAAGGTVSIQALFLAGYLPGLLIGTVLMALAWATARRRGYPAEKAVPFAQASRIVLGAVPALVTPLIIIVPIALGWVPAHQAAVVAVVWAALVSTFWYRSLRWRGYGPLLIRASKTSGMVLILIATAAAFGEVMTYLHVPAQLTDWLLSLSASRVLLMLLINLMLLALGTFMDMAPLIVITTPILLPVMGQLGVDPVHFGIILLLNLAIGLCTPPVGSTLFVGCAIGGISIEKATRALLPFYLAMVVILLIVTFVPELSLWLPGWVAPR